MAALIHFCGIASQPRRQPFEQQLLTVAYVGWGIPQVQSGLSRWRAAGRAHGVGWSTRLPFDVWATRFSSSRRMVRACWFGGSQDSRSGGAEAQT